MKNFDYSVPKIQLNVLQTGVRRLEENRTDVKNTEVQRDVKVLSAPPPQCHTAPEGHCNLKRWRLREVVLVPVVPVCCYVKIYLPDLLSIGMLMIPQPSTSQVSAFCSTFIVSFNSGQSKPRIIRYCPCISSMTNLLGLS